MKGVLSHSKPNSTLALVLVKFLNLGMRLWKMIAAIAAVNRTPGMYEVSLFFHLYCYFLVSM
jgi:hypothetical protein